MLLYEIIVPHSYLHKVGLPTFISLCNSSLHPLGFDICFSHAIISFHLFFVSGKMQEGLLFTYYLNKVTEQPITKRSFLFPKKGSIFPHNLWKHFIFINQLLKLWPQQNLWTSNFDAWFLSDNQLPYNLKIASRQVQWKRNFSSTHIWLTLL